MEFVQIKCKFPEHVSFFTARILMDDFVTDSLQKFKVAPTNEQLQQYIKNKYKNFECDTYYCLLLQLNEEEAFNTVSSRSMASYECPVQKRKLKQEERDQLRVFRKKKKSLKKENEICEICQEDLDNHVYTLPCCSSSFHGVCIRKAMQWRMTCPCCYADLSKLLSNKSDQNKTNASQQ